METVWFWLLAFMGATYVVLGGSDLGVGIVHLFVGRSDDERWQVIRTLRPVWKPNEVWLVAAGGIVFLAFPKLLAVGSSGFYLPLMIVLWLLAGRGLGIELRYQMQEPLWTRFWDVVVAGTSLGLALGFGAALGNVVRGVPLDAEGIFFLPLWTDFRVGAQTGVLDWYTLLVAAAAALALAHHGSLWLMATTDGAVAAGSRRLAAPLWLALMLSLAVIHGASFAVQPHLGASLAARPWGAIFPLVAVGSLIACLVLRRRSRAGRAFLASCLALYALVGSAAVGLHPYVLPAREAAYGLTVHNAAAARSGLLVGLLWFIPGILLVAGYYAFALSKMPRRFSLH